MFDLSTGAAAAAAAVISAGDTITFGNGVDVYQDFVAGAAGDTLDVLTAGAATSATGLARNALGGGAADDILFISGDYNAASGVFTVAADGVGGDTMILDIDQSDSEDIVGSTGIVVLVGVDSDDLVAANFV
jgi:hypothetical protein